MRPYTGRATPVIRDPVVEPFWSGVRVLAHVGPAPAGDTAPVVRLLAGDGVDLGSELPDVVAHVTAAVRALDAVVDGVVTRQVGLQGVGAAPIAEVRASATAVIMRGTADIDIVPRGRSSDATPDDEGFVAVDLLSVDGTDLLDVPLLERKRLLESVVAETQYVRLSVLARPPIDAWIATWKALGLRGGMLKAANSRYEPGERTPEWRVVERVGRQGA
jgi:ATP-dependent DNA ligase